MTESNSLINLGELSKPATVLVERIFDALGGAFEPYQMKRIAKAKAEASLIEAETQIKITDLHRRAMQRFVEEEAQKQNNIENITSKALPLLTDNASPQDIEQDWITNFFEKCRIVSDNEMQQLWSQILAREGNRPGSFSRRTINLMSDLDKRDAELFTTLCKFCWVVGDITPLIFDSGDDIYKKHGINFVALTHLESLGLIRFGHVGGFQRLELPKSFTVYYYGTQVELTMTQNENNSLALGQVLLTNAGKELAPICKAQAISEYFEHVRQKWIIQGIVQEAS